MKRNPIVIAIGVLAALQFSSCVPDIYLFDRQTILEVEASGDWPALDEDIFHLNKRLGPVAFKTDQRQQERTTLSKITDGDYGAKDAAKAQ